METGKRLALTDEERAGIAAAVQAAEQETSAEIVPMIVGNPVSIGRRTIEQVCWLPRLC